MEMSQELGKEELDILNLIKGVPGINVEMVSSSLNVKKEVTKSSLSRLIKYGLVKYSDRTRRNVEITQRGRFFLDRGDPKIATGYPPDSAVPDYVAFRFASGEGILTGDISHSYEEFLGAIERVDSRSIVFHLYRGDFDAWFSEVFRDKKISGKIARLKAKQQPPDRIRTKLVGILQERMREFRKSKG